MWAGEGISPLLLQETCFMFIIGEFSYRVGYAVQLVDQSYDGERICAGLADGSLVVRDDDDCTHRDFATDDLNVHSSVYDGNGKVIARMFSVEDGLTEGTYAVDPGRDGSDYWEFEED